MILLISYFVIINLIALSLLFFNNKRIQIGQSVLPNSTHAWMAILGGAWGVWLGIKLFPRRGLYHYLKRWVPTLSIVYILLFSGSLWLAYDAKHPRCPQCGSRNVSVILYGLNNMSENLRHKMMGGQVVLGGVEMTSEDERYECRACGYRFGRRWGL